MALQTLLLRLGSSPLWLEWMFGVWVRSKGAKGMSFVWVICCCLNSSLWMVICCIYRRGDELRCYRAACIEKITTQLGTEAHAEGETGCLVSIRAAAQR